MLVVRTFFFDLYKIPSPSMEKNLLVGDYLFVSKLHYGTRLPMTLGLPLFQSAYLHGVEFPYVRLPGFGAVGRGDAIVFNHPTEAKPIDRKTHYIKRVVGLPGETLAVVDKVVQVGGQALPLGEDMQQLWDVHKEADYRLSTAQLEEMGVTGLSPTGDPALARVQATAATAEQLRALPFIDRVEPHIASSAALYGNALYPRGRGYTPDNYGPVHIPEQGETVTLTEENWAVYRPVIQDYEGHTVRRLGGGQFEIDGVAATEYTFEQDYYFVMGDSRDNSEDSRFWGFVPFSHIVGKAVMTYFSWNQEGSPPLLGQIRYGRIFKIIGDEI